MVRLTLNSALFLLFVQYAAPAGTFNEDTFAAVQAQEETETGFAWPKITWIFVFQFPIVQILCLIVEESTLVTGYFCPASLEPKFAHIWVQITKSISIGACIIAILRFRGHMKGLMKGKKGLSKVVLFKLVVAIRFLQQWIFSILLNEHAIKVSEQFRYNDILWGIPATLTCAEMVIFAAAFWYAFSPSEYSSTAHPGPAMPIWKAVPHALNPTDLIMGMVRVVPLFLQVRQSGDWSQWLAARRAANKKSGARGAISRGLEASRARRGQNAGRYERVRPSTSAPQKPDESYNMRTVSSRSSEDAGMHGRLSPSDAYQPPHGSPPEDDRQHLMAQAGGWNGQSYEPYGRSRTPSPRRT